MLQPPDTICEYIAEASPHVLSVAIPKVHVHEFAEDSGLCLDVRDEQPLREPRLAEQLIRLWHAAAGEEPVSGLFADQVTRALLAALSRRTDGTRIPRHSRERLPNHTLRRLAD